LTERNLILEAQHVESELFKKVVETKTKTIDKVHERKMKTQQTRLEKNVANAQIKSNREFQLCDSFIVNETSDYVTETGHEIGKSGCLALKLTKADNRRKILEFHGTVRHMTHAEALSSNNQYLIRLKTGRYLDCALQAQTGRCRASMINTPRELIHRKTGQLAKSNVSLYCEGDRAFIVANGTEIPALT
jgi:hypothetical protein